MTSYVKITRPGDRFWCEVLEPFGPNGLKVRVANNLGNTKVHGLDSGKVIIVRKIDVEEFAEK